RTVIANDVNPLSAILTYPRLELPSVTDIDARLRTLRFPAQPPSGLDLSMFFHPDTEFELLGLREYLHRRSRSGKEDSVDRWIRMVAINRLTGHSPGFFSVYTLPPNQAVSVASQRKINEKRNQTPPRRDVAKLILKKSKQLLRDCTSEVRATMAGVANGARFLNSPADATRDVPDNSVSLVVTSPPFLDVVQYA